MHDEQRDEQRDVKDLPNGNTEIALTVTVTARAQSRQPFVTVELDDVIADLRRVLDLTADCNNSLQRNEMYHSAVTSAVLDLERFKVQNG